eukprot:scaffold13206_cov129-Isochrysis_galbana.AAC.1
MVERFSPAALAQQVLTRVNALAEREAAGTAAGSTTISHGGALAAGAVASAAATQSVGGIFVTGVAAVSDGDSGGGGSERDEL